MKRLAVYIVALVMLLSAASWAQSVSGSQNYKLARTYASSGRYAEALTVLDQALKTDPGYADALYLAGICHLALDQYDKALPRLKKLTEVAPDFMSGWGLLTNVYVKLKQYDQATDTIASLAMAKGGKPESHYLAGVVAWLQGDLKKAEQDWRLAIGAKHDMAKAHHNLGILLQTKGDRVRALSSLSEAVRLAHDSALYRLNLGLLQLDMGNKIEGMANLDKVRSQADRQDLAMLALAHQMLYNSHPEQAERAATRAIEANKDLTDAYMVKAKALEALKKLPEAKACYERVMADDVNNLEAKKAVERLTAATAAPAETTETDKQQPTTEKSSEPSTPASDTVAPSSEKPAAEPK